MASSNLQSGSPDVGFLDRGPANASAKGPNERPRLAMLTFGSLAVILAIWWAVTQLGLISSMFVPKPVDVIKALVQTSTDGYRGHTLIAHLAISLARVMAAFSVAALLAIPLGILVGTNRRAEAVLEPLINFYRVLPPLAYYTLLIMWLGIGEAPKVALLALAAFPPIFIAVIQGVRGLSKDRINAALALGVSKRQMMRFIVLPSIRPEIFTGLRVSIGFTYTTLVAAEMVAAESGIGWMVLDASRYLQSNIVFMGIIVMGVTGLALDQLAKLAQRRFVPWEGLG